MSMLTVIIPAREELYLQKTIDNVLENAVGDIEIIAILDGYWPDPPIRDHENVRLLHNTVARGQRHSINDAARFAQGDYVMKLDAHCAVGPGFNEILIRDYEPDMTVIPEMYNLDIETFKPKYFDDYDQAIKKGKVNPYMYIGVVDGNLRAQYYSSWRDRKKFAQRKDIKVDETMCCMGPSFFMSKDRFWELGGCDETHGHWGQQGVEVACKAWLSGGRLMVNKNTWFAHWFRGSYVHPSGKRGFPYPIRQKAINEARKYSNELWRENKWPQATRTFEWLIKKFDPPGWGDAEYKTEESRAELFTPFYNHITGRKHDAKWKDNTVLKYPTDMLLYSEVIYEAKPEIIVEIGTKFGGSALFLQDMLDLFCGGGEVVTLDIKDQVEKKDGRVTYLIGDSKDAAIIEQITKLTKGKKTMLIVDGNHDRRHVKWDLHNYNDLVSVGQFMVVEDCFRRDKKWGPGEARDWFMLNNKEKFVQTDKCAHYLGGVTIGGWLRRAK